jgi:hypothetical protein
MYGGGQMGEHVANSYDYQTLESGTAQLKVFSKIQ